MNAVVDVQAVLRERYGVNTPALRQLAHNWDGVVFHQPRPLSPGWVVRLLEHERASRDARVLSHLERAGYPAPRLVRDRDGNATVPCRRQAVIISTYIHGSPADHSPSTLCRLGQRLGQLHSLELTTAGALPPAGMLPSPDMKTALEWLAPLDRFASSDLRETHDRLLAAIQEVNSSRALPRALIHNDAHPGNAIVNADGDAVFIDWDGSGLGPPMVDLGFLIVSSEIEISWATPIPPAEGRVEAIVRGYASCRIPTPAELEWLPDAIRFRGLLYGAGHLADAVARGVERVTETWWWERNVAARELAERAREQFGRYA